VSRGEAVLQEVEGEALERQDLPGRRGAVRRRRALRREIGRAPQRGEVIDDVDRRGIQL
jgi:hypothetical protein